MLTKAIISKNSSIHLYNDQRACIYSGKYLFSKLSGVDPLFFEDGPEVFCQAAQHIVVGKPAVAVLSPGSAPGVADEEGAFCFLLTEFIGNSHFIVTGLKHHRIAAIKRLTEQEPRCGRLFSSQRQQR